MVEQQTPKSGRFRRWRERWRARAEQARAIEGRSKQVRALERKKRQGRGGGTGMSGRI
jgi:hypothetical protein